MDRCIGDAPRWEERRIAKLHWVPGSIVRVGTLLLHRWPTLLIGSVTATVSFKMLCANESGAPGVFQLLPGSQEPDPHNKIVYSRSAEAGTREWRYTAALGSGGLHIQPLVIFTSFLVLLGQFSSNRWPVQSANTSPAPGDIVTNLRQHWQQYCL